MSQAQFLGTCDRVRRTDEGEADWHIMMAYRVEISQDEFLSSVAFTGVLDEGETFDEFTEIAEREGDPCRFFKTEMPDGLTRFHIQQAGFEWIFE